MSWQIAALLIIVVLIGGCIGFVLGASSALSWGIKVGSYFIDIEVNEELIKEAYWHYQLQVGDWLEENAT